ncbi:MAG: Eco57I restriction-modification methylase domain-containing protein, partial [Ignavibacteriales bacterium]|nr:Eco57I restriction-modification methylase domain-containing protein [Ignavibacteriales bacterium]
DDFKIFVTLFQPQVFVKKDGRCALDEIREKAISFQTSLEEDLRRRIFTVVVDLANGFWQFKDNKLTEKELPDLYNNCLIILYRLLFILYAEGRGLLPVKLSGAGSNKNYRERFSLQRLNVRLKKASEFHSDTFTDLYEELLKLFHLINGDKPKLNKECEVPRYNGGLFNPNNHSAIEKWRVGEKALAQVLRDLIFSSGHTSKSSQPEFEWGTIDYADLEVRQLGDIYEGLLGGHLELQNDKLVLRSERGELQVSGTFYTPDWIVRFLVEKTLKPLIEEIEKSDEVLNALKRKKKDNLFALKVLKLNILDNAMGSGHFLVRATEWLADQIVYHPTTQFQIEKVSPGISQEQTEVAYWRRRVVEACIYGVDSNPLAVELTKLSLWLTCIASNEPLNFLDHHLRIGNSLIGAKLHELSVLPVHQKEEQIPFSFGSNLTNAVSDAIKENEAIEEEASTEIDIVQKKKERWRDKVIKRLDPFRDVANLWISAASGLDINESEYTQLASGFVALPKPRSKEFQEFKSTLEKFKDEYKRITNYLMPFHWELEFPDVFFNDDGTIKDNPGFDAILGNPPYISTQTSSGFEYRNALDQRFGFVDDLYVHFVFQGFNLLRNGGTFGYIVSDTFFTLTTKLRMREFLQRKRLLFLGQCDPFTATVDAAIIVAQKKDAKENYDLHFVQARYETEGSTPDKELVELATKPMPLLINGSTQIEVDGEQHHVLHGNQGCLRLHRIGVDAYRSAVKSTFFEPREAIIQLYNKFNEPLNKLITKWWEKIETSKKFDENKSEIIKYNNSLNAGDITLVGLIAEGGQGLATANNGRFLGYLEGTEQAEKIKVRQNELKQLWNQNNKIAPVLHKLLTEKNNNFEDVIEELKMHFDQYRELGLKKGEIYRTVPVKMIATEEDFKSAYEFRKTELEEQWQKSKDFKRPYEELKQQFGHDFYKLFQAIVNIAIKRKTSLTKLGIRPGEFYTNEEESLRIATIHNGLVGKRYWVSFRKGDPIGNKWSNIEPVFILWSKDNADYMRTSKDARWQGYQYFLKEHGIAWTRGANHTCIKARLQNDCIYDVGGM